MTAKTPFGPYFLGPAGENAELVERFLVEAFRDHVFWRRNFHPEDGPFIQESDRRTPGFDTAVVTLRQELFRLLARLKHGGPFFSPRYIGHMLSDTTIASQVGYFAAMLYNPNNISEEGGNVTMELELEVGEQLAGLVGYGSAAWGHLTSGGSVANLEALWAVRALKYFPAAAALTARELAWPPIMVDTGVTGLQALDSLDPWALMNLPTVSILDLRDLMEAIGREDPRVMPTLAANTLGQQGFLGFHRRFEAAFGASLPEPVVLVPSTKHYSWVKVANLLGLGQSQLIELPLDADYRIDTTRFTGVLERLLAERRPVMALVGVLGSTETGSVDALGKLMRIKAILAGRGLEFYCHIDGAYGGYATAMFKDAQNRWVDWSPYGTELTASFKALPETDSITIDPHKLGYAPYPAGAIIYADRRLREFLTTYAPYVFHQDADAPAAIGQYIVEGSKPGAAAAAVWLNHRVMSLDTEGYGALIGSTVASARALKEALAGFQSADGFRLIPLNEPDLNLVTFVAVPPGVRSLEALNRFNDALYKRFATDPTRVVFTYEFLMSRTAFDPKKYEAGLRARLEPELMDLLADGQPLTVLRCTIMNPFVSAAIASGSYFKELLEDLEREMRALAGQIAPIG